MPEISPTPPRYVLVPLVSPEVDARWLYDPAPRIQIEACRTDAGPLVRIVTDGLATGWTVGEALRIASAIAAAALQACEMAGQEPPVTAIPGYLGDPLVDAVLHLISQEAEAAPCPDTGTLVAAAIRRAENAGGLE